MGGGGKLKIQKGVTISKLPGSSIKFGDRVGLYRNSSLYLDSEQAVVSIGANTYINQRCEIKCMSEVIIGCNCAIAWDVTIMDTDYHTIDNKTMSKPIHIEDNVWIGCKAVILKGITVGEGAVVAAGAVVTKDVPSGSLVAGVPAKIIKENVYWKR